MGIAEALGIHGESLRGCVRREGSDHILAKIAGGAAEVDSVAVAIAVLHDTIVQTASRALLNEPKLDFVGLSNDELARCPTRRSILKSIPYINRKQIPTTTVGEPSQEAVIFSVSRIATIQMVLSIGTLGKWRRTKEG